MDDRALLEALAQRLWEERHVVTYLYFKLTVTKLLLGVDATALVADTLREVDETIAQLRRLEADRAAAVHELAAAWRIDPDVVTLRYLSRSSPSPFDEVFRDHAEAFTELAGSIDAVTGENRVLAQSRLRDVASALDVLGGGETDGAPTATYDARGGIDTLAPASRRLREML